MYILVVLALGKLRQVDQEFKISYKVNWRLGCDTGDPDSKTSACMCVVLENNWVVIFPCHHALNNRNILHLALHNMLEMISNLEMI